MRVRSQVQSPMTLDFLHLKSLALEIGYDDAGFCQAKIPEKDQQAYKKWIKKQYHGDMHYMDNPCRLDPQSYFPEAKSVLMLLTYYKQKPLPFKKSKGLIAAYARAKDYHLVHRKRSKKLLQKLQESYPKLKGRPFSDSFPLLERALAVEAGLGWIGKNTLLIHPRFGTYTLLAGLLLSEPIQAPEKNTPRKWGVHLPRCGSCTRCQEACPVNALHTPYELEANKCLSYHLIESKKKPPPDTHNPGYVFGCDLCQDSCPHNINKAPHHPPDFHYQSMELCYLDQTALQRMEKSPETLYARPLKRKGLRGLKENLQQLEERKTARKGPASLR